MDTSMTSTQLVRLLAEEKRRKVVAALILADDPLSASEVATAAGLTLRDVVDAVDRLASAGLLRDRAGAYELVDETFQQAARAEVAAPEPSAHADQPDVVARVLDVAFKDGKLVQWPSKRTKRLIVLDFLSQHFDIGRRYKEHEVNDLLRVFHDDVAMTRRYLVDEQFLDRAPGSSAEYWRCGGSV